MEQLADLLALSRNDLAARQGERLAALVAAVRQSNPFYQRKLADIAFDAAPPPLTALPFTTRAEIEQDQRDHPPYGTNLSFPLERYPRLHQTSGTNGRPLRWLDTSESWSWWRRLWRNVYQAAGLDPADPVVFTFSFGPFIGFWSAFEAAAEMGCRALAAGGMTSIARLQYLRDHRAVAVCCTPTYALHLAEVADAEGIDLPSLGVRALIVAGEPGGNVPATRNAIEAAWNARVFDHAGMTEIGPWGFELADAPRGLHVFEHEFIAEVIDPATGAAVPDGTLGELVLTNLGRFGSPLIRYRTGDLVVLEPSPCAGCALRWCPGGVRGRLDDMLSIRGNNVFPSALEDILREIPAVAEFRLQVMEKHALSDLVIEIELAPDASADAVRPHVLNAIRDRLHFRPELKFLPPGSLPRFEMKSRRVVRVAPRT